MPAASEAVGAPDGGGGGGGDVEQEYEIRNDEGFVYKVPIGLHLDGAPSSTQPAAGPDPKAAGLSRRRRALLRLRAKRLRDLARWEALASELLAPLPAPQPPASPPASSHPAASAASSSSASILDDLLAQVEMHTEVLKKARQWCDEANALCEAHEAAIFDSIAPLPLLGRNPAELMAGLCSPAASGNLDEQNVCREASGVPSAADEMIKNGVGKKTMGHRLPPILTESRMRKRVTNLSGSSQASIEPKRKKASGSTSNAQGIPGSTKRRKTESTPARGPHIVCSPASTAQGTPGSMKRRKTESTPSKARHIVCSPGPLTRRRAAAQNESPVGS